MDFGGEFGCDRGELMRCVDVRHVVFAGCVFRGGLCSCWGFDFGAVHDMQRCWLPAGEDSCMHACILVCIYVCFNMYVCLCIHLCTYVCMIENIYESVWLPVCTCLCTRVLVLKNYVHHTFTFATPYRHGIKYFVNRIKSRNRYY